MWDDDVKAGGVHDVPRVVAAQLFDITSMCSLTYLLLLTSTVSVWFKAPPKTHLQLRVRDVRLLEAEPRRADEALESARVVGVDGWDYIVRSVGRFGSTATR